MFELINKHIQLAGAAIGVITGGIFLIGYFSTPPEFKGDFSITSTGNKDFIQFLDKNEGDEVTFARSMDVSFALSESREIRKNCFSRSGGYRNVTSNRFANIRMPLPISADQGYRETPYDCETFSIELRSNKRNGFDIGYAGGATAYVVVDGVYKVTRIGSSGHTFIYILTEK